jgi:large subunit ribosomal protein L6
MAVIIPPKVEVELNGTQVRVKGPKGELTQVFSPAMEITKEGNQVVVKRTSDEKDIRALHGTTRAMIGNMVIGVSNGFERLLEVNGIGYRAEMEGNKLVLYVGFSHPVKIEPPAGITFNADAKTRQIKIAGSDKQQVGQVAANIRGVRPPEPYQGKGIKYLEEKIRRKAGKTGK